MKAWKYCSKDDLALNYSGIQWGLREQLHCILRKKEGKYYVLPQYVSALKFKEHIRPGMLDAQETIQSVWERRYGKEPIPKIDLHIMAEEEFMRQRLGWEAYKSARISALNIKEALDFRT
ncbi:MAG: hypothetical protein HY518_00405 [Candidatus Aenigmarchaeota archaeon]|nr:hypothetical protein [Candidatus Aenigmarchaeota archaeon]